MFKNFPVGQHSQSTIGPIPQDAWGTTAYRSSHVPNFSHLPLKGSARSPYTLLRAKSEVRDQRNQHRRTAFTGLIRLHLSCQALPQLRPSRFSARQPLPTHQIQNHSILTPIICTLYRKLHTDVNAPHRLLYVIHPPIL